MDITFTLYTICVLGIKLVKSEGTCLQWVRRDDVINLAPPVGNYITAHDRVSCAKKCAIEETCVSFFYTDSAGNNCLLKTSVVREMDLGSLVYTDNTHYFVLRGAEGGVEHSHCAIDDPNAPFRTVQLSDSTSFTFKVFKVKLTQIEAQQSCMGMDSFLTRVTTMSKLDFLRNLVLCPDYAHDFYIDGSNVDAADPNSLDGWIMGNGDPVPMTSEFWNGPPNIHKSKNCVIFDRQSGSYVAMSCSRKNYYICEKN